MKRFKRIYLEITNICNLSCSFCPQPNRNREFIELDKFKNILVKIQAYTDHIYLHIKGEPLIHPDFNRIIDICTEYGIKVNITTNGTLLSKLKPILLKTNTIRQVNISLHSISVNKNFHDKENYLNNVIAFIKDTRDVNTYISLRLWNLASNNQLEYDNHKLLEMIKNDFQLPFSFIENIKPGIGLKLIDKVFIHQDYTFEWPSLQSKEFSDKGFCFGLRDHIGILVDGTVIPCCLDGDGIINLGNIHNQSLDEIINSGRAKAIYEGFSNRKVVEELCKGCGYRSKMN